MTNLEHIKQMNIDEMEDWLVKITECRQCPLKNNCDYDDYSCRDNMYNWLNAEMSK